MRFFILVLALTGCSNCGFEWFGGGSLEVRIQHESGEEVVYEVEGVRLDEFDQLADGEANPTLQLWEADGRSRAVFEGFDRTSGERDEVVVAHVAAGDLSSLVAEGPAYLEVFVDVGQDATLGTTFTWVDANGDSTIGWADEEAATYSLGELTGTVEFPTVDWGESPWQGATVDYAFDADVRHVERFGCDHSLGSGSPAG